MRQKIRIMRTLLAVILCIAVPACQKTGRAPAQADGSPEILFSDPMTVDWREHWFLDGERAILENKEDGLHYTATPSNVNKNEARELFDAHHAVIWTKQEFAGDIAIRYEFTRVSPGFTSLLYIHARGIGTPPYEEDIHAWRHLRTTSAMNLYFTHMNLTCFTFREQIRPRRYPWVDAGGKDYEDRLIGEMLDYDKIPVGQSYTVEVEWRRESLTLRLTEIGNPANVLERAFDTTEGVDSRRPPLSDRGRIGLRHMGGTAFIYRNFEVRSLAPRR